MSEYDQIQSGVAAVGTICVAIAGLFIVLKVLRKAGRGCEAEKMPEFRDGIMLSFFGGSVIYGFLGTLGIISVTSIIGLYLFTVGSEHLTLGNRYVDWGEPSSIAFCEADFAFSALVAEPANAITSALSFVPLSLIGIIILSQRAPHKEVRFVVLYVCLGVIGLGSTLLHTTLRASMQAADELPMLWGCAALAFHFADDYLAKGPSTRLRRYLPLATCGVVLVQTVGYYFAHEVFAFFAVACLIVVFTSFAYLGSQAWRVVNAPVTNTPEDLAARNVMIPMMAAGGFSGVTCLTCWASEMFGCVSIVQGHVLGSVVAPFIWQYLMHPAWHIFGCFSVWAVAQMLVILWGSRLGWTKPYIAWMGVPVVMYHDKGS